MVVAVTPAIWVVVKSLMRSSAPPLRAEMVVALRLLTWVVVRPARAAALSPPRVVELRLLRSVAVRACSCGLPRALISVEEKASMVVVLTWPT